MGATKYDDDPNDPAAMYVKNDGTSIFMTDNDPTAEVIKFNLSISHDVTSGSIAQILDVSSELARVGGIFFKPDGTEMYLCGYRNNTVSSNDSADFAKHYSLSTAWDLSTAVLQSTLDTNFDPSGSFDTNIYYINLSDDGKRLFFSYGFSTGNAVGFNTAAIHQYGLRSYTLSTAWNMSTASLEKNRIIPGYLLRAGMQFVKGGEELHYMSLSKNTLYPMDVNV